MKILPQMYLGQLSLWLNTIHGGLEWLLVYGPEFSSQGWPGNLGQGCVRICFGINFLDRKGFSGVLYNLWLLVESNVVVVGFCCRHDFIKIC